MIQIVLTSFVLRNNAPRLASIMDELMLRIIMERAWTAPLIGGSDTVGGGYNDGFLEALIRKK